MAVGVKTQPVCGRVFVGDSQRSVDYEISNDKLYTTGFDGSAFRSVRLPAAPRWPRSDLLFGASEYCLIGEKVVLKWRYGIAMHSSQNDADRPGEVEIRDA